MTYRLLRDNIVTTDRLVALYAAKRDGISTIRVSASYHRPLGRLCCIEGWLRSQPWIALDIQAKNPRYSTLNY